MHIIFVDDKKENIEAAQRSGFKGLRFTSAKKLRKKFKEIGVR
jgi:hypothetical protein